MRIGLAIRAFFAVLFNRQLADAAKRMLAGPDDVASTTARKDAPPTAVKKPAPTPPARNDAISLLETLQREARFVDIVKEPLGDYDDAQIGAAARDVLRDCASVLDRLFALQPILDQDEGATVETPATVDASRYRLTGNVTGEPPFRGRLVHHGWQATRCELPRWSGGKDSALIVAPIEIELK